MRRLSLAVATAMLLLPAIGHPAAAGDLPRAEPVQVGLDAAKLDRADALFREAVDKKKIAGAVLLVAGMARWPISVRSASRTSRPACRCSRRRSSASPR